MSNWAKVVSNSAAKPAPKAPAKRPIVTKGLKKPEWDETDIVRIGVSLLAAGKADSPHHIFLKFFQLRYTKITIPAKIPRPPRSWRIDQRRRAQLAEEPQSKDVEADHSEADPARPNEVASFYWPADVLRLLCQHLSFPHFLMISIASKDLRENMFSFVIKLHLPTHRRKQGQIAYPVGAAKLFRRTLSAAEASHLPLESFRPPHYISDSHFDIILSKLPQLTNLYLIDCRLLSRDVLLKHLHRLAPQLTGLVISGRCSLKEEDLQELVPQMKNLKELRLCFRTYADIPADVFSPLIKLRKLELRSVTLPELSEDFEGPMEELRLVNNRGKQSSLPEMMRILSRTSAGHLKILQIAHSSGRLRNDVLLATSEELRRGLRVINFDNARIWITMPAWEPFICHCINLEVLHFKNAFQLGLNKAYLTQLPKLRRLVFTAWYSPQRNVKVADFKPFLELRELEYLDVSFGGFGRTIPKAFFKLPKLRTLVMKVGAITEPVDTTDPMIPKHIRVVTGKSKRSVSRVARQEKVQAVRLSSDKVKFWMSLKNPSTRRQSMLYL